MKRLIKMLNLRHIRTIRKHTATSKDDVTIIIMSWRSLINQMTSSVLPTIGIIFLLSFWSTTTALSMDYVEIVRQNLDDKSNSDLVAQMLAFQRASLVYLGYASYYDRSDIHLPGFRKFFLGLSNKTRTDSRTIVDYINIRGGYQQFGVINVSEACTMMQRSSTLLSNIENYTPEICSLILAPKARNRNVEQINIIDDLSKQDQTRFLKTKIRSKDGFKRNKFHHRKSAHNLDNKGVNHTSNRVHEKHGLKGLIDALLMERFLQWQVNDLAKGAQFRSDPHMKHTIEASLFDDRIKRIEQLSSVITRLQQYSDEDYALGEIVMDNGINKQLFI